MKKTMKIKEVGTKTTSRLKKYFEKIISIIKMPEMGVLPGQLAFFILLSLVPIVTLSCYIANLFEFDYTKIITTLNQFVPGGITYLIPNIASGITLPMIILLVWMFYIASSGCNTIILIANEIYGIRQSTWVKRRIKAMFMTIMIVILVLALLLLSVYEVRFQGMISTWQHGDKILYYLNYLEIPITFLIILLFLRLFYNFAPDRMRKTSHINIGTIFTALGWTGVTIIYGIIAKNMVNYELLYGGLANVALLMIWLYFVSYIFVLGLALNYGEEI